MDREIGEPIFGQGIADPNGQIWSGAMTLEHLGEREAAQAIEVAIVKVLADANAPKTPRRLGIHK
jgi:isocitrate/isopropylmalate dehydrogenase